MNTPKRPNKKECTEKGKNIKFIGILYNKILLRCHSLLKNINCKL